MEAENAKVLSAKGELSDENTASYEKLRKSFDQLLRGVSSWVFFGPYQQKASILWSFIRLNVMTYHFYFFWVCWMISWTDSIMHFCHFWTKRNDMRDSWWIAWEHAHDSWNLLPDFFFAPLNHPNYYNHKIRLFKENKDIDNVLAWNGSQIHPYLSQDTTSIGHI